MNGAAPAQVIPCACTLEATAERLAARQGKTLPDDERALLQRLENCDPNGEDFEAHMVFEEQVLAPHMLPRDRFKLTSQHAVIRACRRRKIPVPVRFFESHAAWERDVFPTLGQAKAR